LLALLVATLLLLPNLGALVGIARPPGRFDTYSWSHPLYLLVTAGLLYAALHASIAPAMLANRVMRWLGAISYSVYLLHLPIIIYLDRFTPLGDRPLAFAGAALGLILLASSASHYALERPLRRAIVAAFNRRGERAAPA
jgi:peptidoglycan/LPS O-acetylase OafA/YrhL